MAGLNFPGSVLCQYYQHLQEMKIAAETYFSELTATIAKETIKTWEVEIGNAERNRKVNPAGMDIFAARQNMEPDIVTHTPGHRSAGIAEVFDWVFRIEENQFVFSPFLYFCCI